MSDQPGLAAEQSLLGALLINGRLDAVPPDLRPDDFGSVTHQRIYATMRMLHADGLVVDTTTVYEALRDWDLNKKSYLVSLLDFVPNPDAEGIASYASLVKQESAIRRRRAWAT